MITQQLPTELHHFLNLNHNKLLTFLIIPPHTHFPNIFTLNIESIMNQRSTNILHTITSSPPNSFCSFSILRYTYPNHSTQYFHPNRSQPQLPLLIHNIHWTLPFIQTTLHRTNTEFLTKIIQTHSYHPPPHPQIDHSTTFNRDHYHIIPKPTSLQIHIKTPTRIFHFHTYHTNS